MKDDNIHSLPNADRSKASYAIMKRFMPEIIEQMPLIAEMRMANYKAHIDQGFTPEQALILCTNMGCK